MSQIRLLIVDDHAIVREGLRTLLDEDPTILVVGEAGNGQEGIKAAQALRPQVILMDLVMPEMDGITATQQIKQTVADCQVLVLGLYSSNQVT